MDKVEDKISHNRRNIIKGAAMAAAAVVTSGTAGGATSAQTPDACGVEGIREPEHVTIPRQAPVTEGVLPLSGGAGIYYWDTGGDGPAVVFSHPGTGSALSWPYQQPVFAAAGFRTIAYSRRGRYGSPAGSLDDTGSYAGDLDALMVHLNIDKFHMVGLAAGGFVVSDYAVSYPDKLMSMVIACSLFGLWDKDIDSRSDFILSKGFSAMPSEFKEIGPAYRWAHPEGVREWIEMEEKSSGAGPRVHQRDMSEITWDKIRSLNIPAFFIAGGADLYQPPSMMRAAARQMPGSETLVVPEVGHAVQWEQPELFNRVVIEFFRKHA